jgi:hypothetical protein
VSVFVLHRLWALALVYFLVHELFVFIFHLIKKKLLIRFYFDKTFTLTFRSIFLRKMLTSAPGALVKELNKV